MESTKTAKDSHEINAASSQKFEVIDMDINVHERLCAVCRIMDVCAPR